MAHAVITRHAVLADDVIVHPGAVVGGDPQHLTFDTSIETFVHVGAKSVIREHVTLNRGTIAGAATVIGERCFLMAGSHVAHDCTIGNDVVLANNAMIAGHVTIGDFTFVGGGAGIHQHCRIGQSAMVAGLARITRDLAPYTLNAERDEVSGLNLVGLRRRGVSADAIRELKLAFRSVFLPNGNIRDLANEAISSGQFETAEAQHFLAFFATGKRGFARAAYSGATGSAVAAEV